ncbi:hypothetical protein ENSA5_42800 [Enhygromyxa salina]|uniref:Uncharacterized protein n=1 Tax=Enhygromyxa salina TaxID=215803 RepID=A0A2S9XL19_9BACT|nr:choice-of-anchor L domain-containing protein [Enhygromyxa salina]PRP93381.1 hypothetical protein ENSA5_42800 [Enhygromyxa salina]
MARRLSLVGLALLTGCELSTVVGVRDLATEGGGASEVGDSDDQPVLDLPPDDCAPPAPVSCDASSDDPLQVVGLDCVGGIPAAGGVSAPAGAVAPHLGPLGPYEVREGEKFLILSTGLAGHLGLSLAELAAVCDPDDWPEFCPNTQHGAGPTTLPAPMTVEPVDDTLTCADDPSLIGAGDCSNSLYDQWAACEGGCEVWDYAELRVGLTVPDHAQGLAFDFAFMSVEWPSFAGGGFNDMFVAWLESESWTGNVSFDTAGNPITVNAGFTDYTGDELDGFAMEGHAGTRWLTTGFGLEPGESVELVLAVFDLTDDDHDSVVLLDAFRWTCDGARPLTEPVP